MLGKLMASKRTPRDRLAARGVTPAFFAAQRSQSPPETTMKPLRKSSQKAHDKAAEKFNEYLDEYPATISSKTYRCMDDFISDSHLFAPRLILQPFLLWWASGAAGVKLVDGKRNERIEGKTLLNFYAVFCAAWRRRLKGLKSPSEERLKGLEYCFKIINDLKLTDTPCIRAQLNKQSLLALYGKLFDHQHELDVRARLATLTYIALSTQTGLRPSSVLRPSGPSGKDYSGAKYGDFNLAVVRTPAGFQLHGYYSPKFAKTKHSKDLTYPLPPGPTLATSTCHLLLLSLYLDGGISSDELGDFLSPDFLSAAETTKPCHIPFGWAEKNVFVNSHGTAMSVGRCSSILVDLSIAVGFEQPVTTYCFRHMVAQALERQGDSLESIQNALGHQIGSSATKYYLGNALLFQITTYARDKSVDLVLRERLLSLNAQPNVEAPTMLDDEDLKEAHDSDELLEYKQEVQNARTARAEAVDTGCDPLVLKAAHQHLERTKLNLLQAQKRSERRKLLDNRRDFFSHRKTTTAAQRSKENPGFQVFNDPESPLGMWLKELQTPTESAHSVIADCLRYAQASIDQQLDERRAASKARSEARRRAKETADGQQGGEASASDARSSSDRLEDTIEQGGGDGSGDEADAEEDADAGEDMHEDQDVEDLFDEEEDTEEDAPVGGSI